MFKTDMPTIKQGATALALVLAPAICQAAEPGDVVEYVAEYDVYYDERRLASAEFQVAREGESDSYVFTTSTKVRAMLRMLRPGSASELSQFQLGADGIEPARYSFEDGTRKSEDNYTVSFDRAAGTVNLASAAGNESIPYENGLLDRGSLQVVLMRDLSLCMQPTSYLLIDDDGIETYAYERLEDLETDTGIGEIATERYLQQRAGSSRTTTLWFAPELAYLPVRMEQARNGEIETVFVLDKVDGLDRQPSTC